METFRHWSSPYGYVLFMLLAAISKGSACGALSSPQCFRRNETASIYICEWSFNTNESAVTFSLYFTDIFGTEKKFENIETNHTEIIEEVLTVSDRVDIWVEAHVGHATCTSPNVSGLLIDSVKYDAPQNISVSWLRNNLSLSWQAAERYPALAEVWFKKHGNPAESCEKRLINTTNEASKYNVVIVNLVRSSAYQVRIRHLATKYKSPLWSNWSPFVTVPAALDRKLEVTHTSRLLNGTRQVTLTWKPIPHQATLRGVTYSVTDTQSSHGCPCKKKKSQTRRNSNHHTLHVSYSAVNITVAARNEAGRSPETIIQVPAASAADLKICDKTLLNEKLKRRTCLELYELQDADLNPESVMILTARQLKKEGEGLKNNMKNFTRYLYFEHRCHNGKPRTVKVCLFYLKEGAPNKEPQYDKTVPKTHSVSLSWKEISYEHHRGFLTHYSLCSTKISPQKEPKECFNISASMTQHHLENLTPGAEYNITLAGATRAGEGLLAAQIIKTLQEKPVNVWLSFGLLVVFFILSAVCTVFIKRIKTKIFPPVPTSVILDFIPRHPQEQEMCDAKEEVHELTLHQLVPEQTPVSEETPVLSVLKGEWDDSTDEDVEKERSDSAGSDDECLSLDSAGQTLSKSQVEAELSRLKYRNGLVFDVKSESS